MKKTVIALAIASTATSVSAVELYKSDIASIDFYGHIRTELKKDDGDEPTLRSGSSRTGIDANYRLNDGLTLQGKVEFGLRDEGAMTVRNHILGFKTDDYGTLSLGKQWVISDDAWGADYSYFYGGSGLRHATLSKAVHNSLIKYTYDADNYWIKANYGVDSDNKEQELIELYAGVSFGDLSFHAGAGKNTDKNFEVGKHKVAVNGDDKVTVDQKVTHDLTNTYYQLTTEYKLGSGVIGFTYYNASIESNTSDWYIDEDAFSLGGKFKVADKTSVYAGYEFTQYKTNVNNVKNEDFTNAYLGAEYLIASWARIYAEYGYRDGSTLGYSNQASDTQVAAKKFDSENRFAIGARVYW